MASDAEQRLIEALCHQVLKKVNAEPSFRSEYCLRVFLTHDHVAIRYLRCKKWNLERALGQVWRPLQWASETGLDDFKLADFSREIMLFTSFTVNIFSCSCSCSNTQCYGMS